MSGTLLQKHFSVWDRIVWPHATRATGLPDLGSFLDHLASIGVLVRSAQRVSIVHKLARSAGMSPAMKAALATRPVGVWRAQAQDVVSMGADIDLVAFPIQTHWPGEPAPLVTWGLVITAPPGDLSPRQTNVGAYRLQVLGRNRVMVR